jgi:alanine dehydrogenase
MSEIAGRLTPPIGAHHLQHQAGGHGILLSGSVGVRPGRVVVLGCGIVGSAAARRVSSGVGVQVLVMDRDLDRLRRLKEAPQGGGSQGRHHPRCHEHGHKGRRPRVNSATVEGMKPRSVMVDVDVDRGGCVETSRPTTLQQPIYKEAGVTHYCVKNMPTAVPVTNTKALSDILLPYVREVAGRGLMYAINSDAGFGRGVAVAEGRVVDPVLARATGTEHNLLSSVLTLRSEAR